MKIPGFKYVFLFCILSCGQMLTSSAMAQTYSKIEGVLVDSTFKNIPFVHLQIVNTPYGAVANQEGAFSFPLRDGHLEDTVLFSAMGYEPLKLKMSQLVSKDTIILKESSITLKPVLISSLSAEEILRKSIQSIPANHAQEESFIRGFYRTAHRECGSFAHLQEGPVKMVDPGYQRGDSVMVSYDYQTKSEDYRKYQLQDKYSLNDALTFEHVRLRNSFMNSDQLDSWKLEIVDYTQFENRGVMVVLADYISDKKRMDHTARIYIDDKNYAIYKVEYEFKWHENHFQGSEIDSLSEAEHHWEGSFHYAYQQDQLYLKYFFFHHTKSIFDNFYKRKICDIEVFSEFIMHEVMYSGEENNMNGSDKSSYELYTKPVETELYQSIMTDMDSLSNLQN